MGKFEPDISEKNIAAVSKKFIRLGYDDGPSHLECDDTKVRDALAGFVNSEMRWQLVGQVGESIEIDSVEKLEQLLESLDIQKADKVRSCD